MSFKVGDRVFFVGVGERAREYATVTEIERGAYWVRLNDGAEGWFVEQELADAKTMEPCKEPPGYRPRKLAQKASKETT